MDRDADAITIWIAKEIVPHERSVRRWLSPRCKHGIDVEDIVQEAYCRLAGLSSVDHIENPPAYFFRTVQTIFTDKMRRSRIIDFTLMTQIEWSDVIDNEPSPERAVGARQELEWVTRLLSQLSDIRRRAIELRRIEGLSRKEAAERLGVTEDALKKHVERGLLEVMKAMSAEDAQEHDEWSYMKRKAE